MGRGASYKLLLVAFSICSSRAVLAEDDHHPIMAAKNIRRLGGEVDDGSLVVPGCIGLEGQNSATVARVCRIFWAEAPDGLCGRRWNKAC
jgi:hypothetical protein